MIKAIIFDYDGVIVDSFSSVHKAYQVVCKKLGKKCPSSLGGFKKAFGYNLKDLIKNLKIQKKEVGPLNRIFKEEIIKTNSPLFKGIKDTIKELSKKYTLVIVSSNLKVEVKQKIKNKGLEKEFDMIIGSKLGSLVKVEGIKKIMNKLNLNPKEVIMIGDRTVDFDESIEAGLPPENIILVEYGWGYNHRKVPRQDPIVKNPKDILAAIESK